MGLQSMNVWEKYTIALWKLCIGIQMKYIYGNKLNICAFSSCFETNLLEKWNEIEKKQIGEQLLKLLTVLKLLTSNSTNTTNYWHC